MRYPPSFLSRRVLPALLALSVFLFSFSVRAEEPVPVHVTFWKENSELVSVADKCIDHSRTALLCRQENGKYTLELPVCSLYRMGITGTLTGLTVDGISYLGELSGSYDDGTALLTLSDLPPKIKTEDGLASHAVPVTCTLQMDMVFLGDMNPTARLCIWTD